MYRWFASGRSADSMPAAGSWNSVQSCAGSREAMGQGETRGPSSDGLGRTEAVERIPAGGARARRRRRHASRARFADQHLYAGCHEDSERADTTVRVLADFLRRTLTGQLAPEILHAWSLRRLRSLTENSSPAVLGPVCDPLAEERVTGQLISLLVLLLENDLDLPSECRDGYLQRLAEGEDLGQVRGEILEDLVRRLPRAWLVPQGGKEFRSEARAAPTEMADEHSPSLFGGAGSAGERGFDWVELGLSAAGCWKSEDRHAEIPRTPGESPGVQLVPIAVFTEECFRRLELDRVGRACFSDAFDAGGSRSRTAQDGSRWLLARLPEDQIPSFGFRYIVGPDGLAEVVVDVPSIGARECIFAARLFALHNDIGEVLLDGIRVV